MSLLSGPNYNGTVVIYGFCLLRDLVTSSLALYLKVLVRVPPLGREVGSRLCLLGRHVDWDRLLVLVEIAVWRRGYACFLGGLSVGHRLYDA